MTHQYSTVYKPHPAYRALSHALTVSQLVSVETTSVSLRVDIEAASHNYRNLSIVRRSDMM